MTYIDMDQDGLQDDIARLIAGERIIVDTGNFQNDVETFTGKDDVLTLLIHLGYLTYEEVADSYDEEVETILGTLTSLMEPFLMVFLGAIIGTIVLAMFMPIFNMGSLAS